MSALILSYIWIWQGTFVGDVVVCAVAFIALVIAGHRRRRETLRNVGFRWDNLSHVTRLLALVVGPLILLALGVGAWSKSYWFPPLVEWPGEMAALILWGTLQQYTLLVFYYRRFLDVMGGALGAIILTSCLFSVFHAPNPFLVVFGLCAGVISCVVYHRVPNVPAIGVAHGLVSFCFYYALPRTLTTGLRIGWSFWET